MNDKRKRSFVPQGLSVKLLHLKKHVRARAVSGCVVFIKTTRMWSVSANLHFSKVKPPEIHFFRVVSHRAKNIKKTLKMIKND